jgi:hypothetical protein
VSALVSDPWAAAAHRNMASALSGPRSAGATATQVAIDAAAASAAVGWTSYEPVLLAAPRASLGLRTLRLVATPGGAAPVTLTYAPRSEAGSFLLLYRPEVNPATRTAPPFTVALQLFELAAGGAASTEVTDELADRVELVLLEGTLGRVAYALGAEKARLRRQARDLPRQHPLSEAEGPELDRRGLDLDVPRFAERLTVQGGVVTPEPETEGDAAYRARLTIYQPWMQPSGAGLARLLEHPGLTPEPAGAQFAVDDRGERFAVALKVLAAGDANLRTRFLEHVRLVHLVLPANNPFANTVHARRFLPLARRQADTALRAELRRLFSFGTATNPALARPLAVALVRVARCREALVAGPQWECLRTQQADAGSRYELGLAADLAPLTPDELRELVQRHAARAPAADPEIEALLGGMQPRPPELDEDGRWLLEPCGLRTVHRVDGTRLLVSHLPFDGMVVEGPPAAPLATPTPLEARYHARLDPGPNAVLADGVAAALEQWTAAHPPWTQLTDAQARTRWAAAQPLGAGAPAIQVLRDAGLSAVATPAPVVARLRDLRPELLATLQLPPALSQAIVQGDQSAVTDLRTLVGLLRAQWLTAALPLVTGPAEVVLVAAVTRLPEAGTNLSRRRATGVRWYAERVTGADGEIAPRVGPQSSFTPSAPGVVVVMALGYARRGVTAPYELRVTLPPGALIGFSQYEVLMNVLDHAHPLGIGVNTAEIRRDHVDLDDDGDADPLSPSLSRSYRAFRPRRSRIAGDVFSPETPGLQVGVHSTIGVDTILAPP